MNDDNTVYDEPSIPNYYEPEVIGQTDDIQQMNVDILDVSDDPYQMDVTTVLQIIDDVDTQLHQKESLDSIGARLQRQYAVNEFTKVNNQSLEQANSAFRSVFAYGIGQLPYVPENPANFLEWKKQYDSAFSGLEAIKGKGTASNLLATLNLMGSRRIQPLLSFDTNDIMTNIQSIQPVYTDLEGTGYFAELTAEEPDAQNSRAAEAYEGDRNEINAQILKMRKMGYQIANQYNDMYRAVMKQKDASHKEIVTYQELVEQLAESSSKFVHTDVKLNKADAKEFASKIKKEPQLGQILGYITVDADQEQLIQNSWRNFTADTRKSSKLNNMYRLIFNIGSNKLNEQQLSHLQEAYTRSSDIEMRNAITAYMKAGQDSEQEYALGQVVSSVFNHPKFVDYRKYLQVLDTGDTEKQVTRIKKTLGQFMSDRLVGPGSAKYVTVPANIDARLEKKKRAASNIPDYEGQLSAYLAGQASKYDMWSPSGAMLSERDNRQNLPKRMQKQYDKVSAYGKPMESEQREQALLDDILFSQMEIESRLADIYKSSPTFDPHKAFPLEYARMYSQLLDDTIINQETPSALTRMSSSEKSNFLGAVSRIHYQFNDSIQAYRPLKPMIEDEVVKLVSTQLNMPNARTFDDLKVANGEWIKTSALTVPFFLKTVNSDRYTPVYAARYNDQDGADIGLFTLGAKQLLDNADIQSELSQKLQTLKSQSKDTLLSRTADILGQDLSTNINSIYVNMSDDYSKILTRVGKGRQVDDRLVNGHTFNRLLEGRNKMLEGMLQFNNLYNISKQVNELPANAQSSVNFELNQYLNRLFIAKNLADNNANPQKIQQLISEGKSYTSEEAVDKIAEIFMQDPQTFNTRLYLTEGQLAKEFISGLPLMAGPAANNISALIQKNMNDLHSKRHILFDPRIVGNRKSDLIDSADYYKGVQDAIDRVIEKRVRQNKSTIQENENDISYDSINVIFNDFAYGLYRDSLSMTLQDKIAALRLVSNAQEFQAQFANKFQFALNARLNTTDYTRYYSSDADRQIHQYIANRIILEPEQIEMMEQQALSKFEFLEEIMPSNQEESKQNKLIEQAAESQIEQNEVIQLIECSKMKYTAELAAIEEEKMKEKQSRQKKRKENKLTEKRGTTKVKEPITQKIAKSTENVRNAKRQNTRAKFRGLQKDESPQLQSDPNLQQEIQELNQVLDMQPLTASNILVIDDTVSEVSMMPDVVYPVQQQPASQNELPVVQEEDEYSIHVISVRSQRKDDTVSDIEPDMRTDEEFFKNMRVRIKAIGGRKYKGSKDPNDIEAQQQLFDQQVTKIQDIAESTTKKLYKASDAFQLFANAASATSDVSKSMGVLSKKMNTKSKKAKDEVTKNVSIFKQQIGKLITATNEQNRAIDEIKEANQGYIQVLQEMQPLHSMVQDAYFELEPQAVVNMVNQQTDRLKPILGKQLESTYQIGTNMNKVNTAFDKQQKVLDKLKEFHDVLVESGITVNLQQEQKNELIADIATVLQTREILDSRYSEVTNLPVFKQNFPAQLKLMVQSASVDPSSLPGVEQTLTDSFAQELNRRERAQQQPQQNETQIQRIDDDNEEDKNEAIESVEEATLRIKAEQLQKEFQEEQKSLHQILNQYQSKNQSLRSHNKSYNDVSRTVSEMMDNSRGLVNEIEQQIGLNVSAIDIVTQTDNWTGGTQGVKVVEPKSKQSIQISQAFNTITSDYKQQLRRQNSDVIQMRNNFTSNMKQGNKMQAFIEIKDEAQSFTDSNESQRLSDFHQIQKEINEQGILSKNEKKSRWQQSVYKIAQQSMENIIQKRGPASLPSFRQYQELEDDIQANANFVDMVNAGMTRDQEIAFEQHLTKVLGRAAEGVTDVMVIDEAEEEEEEDREEQKQNNTARQSQPVPNQVSRAGGRQIQGVPPPSQPPGGGGDDGDDSDPSDFIPEDNKVQETEEERNKKKIKRKKKEEDKKEEEPFNMRQFNMDEITKLFKQMLEDRKKEENSVLLLLNPSSSSIPSSSIPAQVQAQVPAPQVMQPNQDAGRQQTQSSTRQTLEQIIQSHGISTKDKMEAIRLLARIEEDKSRSQYDMNKLSNDLNIRNSQQKLQETQATAQIENQKALSKIKLDEIALEKTKADHATLQKFIYYKQALERDEKLMGLKLAQSKLTAKLDEKRLTSEATQRGLDRSVKSFYEEKEQILRQHLADNQYNLQQLTINSKTEIERAHTSLKETIGEKDNALKTLIEQNNTKRQTDRNQLDQLIEQNRAKREQQVEANQQTRFKYTEQTKRQFHKANLTFQENLKTAELNFTEKRDNAMLQFKKELQLDANQTEVQKKTAELKFQKEVKDAQLEFEKQVKEHQLEFQKTVRIEELQKDYERKVADNTTQENIKAKELKFKEDVFKEQVANQQALKTIETNFQIKQREHELNFQYNLNETNRKYKYDTDLLRVQFDNYQAQRRNEQDTNQLNFQLLMQDKHNTLTTNMKHMNDQLKRDLRAADDELKETLKNMDNEFQKAMETKRLKANVKDKAEQLKFQKDVRFKELETKISMDKATKESIEKLREIQEKYDLDRYKEDAKKSTTMRENDNTRRLEERKAELANTAKIQEMNNTLQSTIRTENNASSRLTQQILKQSEENIHKMNIDAQAADKQRQDAFKIKYMQEMEKIKSSRLQQERKERQQERHNDSYRNIFDDASVNLMCSRYKQSQVGFNNTVLQLTEALGGLPYQNAANPNVKQQVVEQITQNLGAFIPDVRGEDVQELQNPQIDGLSTAINNAKLHNTTSAAYSQFQKKSERTRSNLLDEQKQAGQNRYQPAYIDKIGRLVQDQLVVNLQKEHLLRENSTLDDVVKLLANQDRDIRRQAQKLTSQQIVQEMAQVMHNHGEQVKYGQFVNYHTINSYAAIDQELGNLLHEYKRNRAVNVNDEFEQFIFNSRHRLQAQIQLANKHNESISKAIEHKLDVIDQDLANTVNLTSKKEKAEEKVEYSYISKSIGKIQEHLSQAGLNSGAGNSGMSHYSMNPRSLGYQMQSQYGNGNVGKEQYMRDRMQGNKYMKSHGTDQVQAEANLVRLSKQVEELDEEDVYLLQHLVVDKRSGRVLYMDDDGQVMPLNEEQEERATAIIIEILMFILMSHVKGVGEEEAKSVKEKIEENVEEGGTDLLPLVKIANVLANKISYGSVREDTIMKYVAAAMGGTDTDAEMK